MHQSGHASSFLAIVPKRHMLLLGAVFAAIAVAVTGCGTGTTFAPVDGGGGGDTTRTFVGRAVCAGCHAEIDAQFSEPSDEMAHGKNFTLVHGQPAAHGEQIYPPRASCAPCHTTGYNEPSGFNPDGSTPQLENIGCEECHGPGSQHAVSPSESNINRTPTSVLTCLDCHAPSYKQFRSPTQPVTDASATLRNTAPSRISIHRPPLVFGRLLYNREDTPGPHSLIENTCATCHMNEAAGSGHDPEMPHPDMQACVACHGDATGIIDELQEEIKTALIELGGEDPEAPGEPNEAPTGGLIGAYAAAHPYAAAPAPHGVALDGTNNDPDDPAVRVYKAARYIYSYVALDGSFGVHNPGLAEAMLEDARRLVE